MSNEETSPAVGRGVVVLHEDDEDLENEIQPPANRSTGGTPLRRSSSSLLRSPPTSAPTSRNNTPRPRSISYDELASRPRSNPRSRTPMRYESPLNANAFRAASPRQEGQRVTIRPLAGSAVGTTLLSRRIQEEGGARTTNAASSHTARSSKQGPSHRKAQRWNRDNFVGLASHLARHSSSTGVAETMLLAQADAPRYKSIYDPSLDQQPSAMSTFIQDDQFEQARHQFFEGEIGHGVVAAVREERQKQGEEKGPCLQKIHERLRSVVVRGCSSVTTVQEMDALEACLKDCFQSQDNEEQKKSSPSASSLLLLQQAGVDTFIMDGQPVVVTNNRTNRATVHFYFDATSSRAGFHRLLLHALCQFHGLAATSRTTTSSGGGINAPARLLTVTGKRFDATTKLTDHVLEMANMEEETTASAESPETTTTTTTMHQLETRLSATTIQA